MNMSFLNLSVLCGSYYRVLKLSEEDEDVDFDDEDDMDGI